MAGMIAAVIPTLNAERTLGEVLAALVPAAAEGLVREVVIVDAGSTDRTLEIAEDGGATVVAGMGSRRSRIAAGVAAVARGAWILVLDQATVPKEGWRRAAEQALMRGRPGRVPVDGEGLMGALARPRAGSLRPK